ncbi:hypothetical protein TRFO_35389 [Tritrichomonas foetus]|uniref:Uncharacterized protein n=1 Tax=Tritrichomonas foetus TaxID=1144522 RepID=A0A1J4JKY5_9EUKA|nr:hypothetical protein TRFO_35389 [Tritrichomonas foetus]|eukprot:OHS98235.1 hypothetical protein TRFO_35389 [Tritrichomonas foetus]
MNRKRNQSQLAQRSQRYNRDRLFQSSLSNRSLPYPDFRHTKNEENENNENLKPLPRNSVTTSLKHRKPVPFNRSCELPVSYVEPPILAIEQPAEDPELIEARKMNKNAFRLPIDELRSLYKDLVMRYKLGADQFNKLERKRAKMTNQLDILRKQVKNLEKEQAIVEAEFVRLGLASTNSPSPNPKPESHLAPK